MKLTAYHGSTNTTEEIELSGKDKENLEKDIAKLAADRLAREEQRAKNAIAKIAVLERLGITAEEATLLLG